MPVLEGEPLGASGIITDIRRLFSGEGLRDLYSEGAQGEVSLTPLPYSQVPLEAFGQA